MSDNPFNRLAIRRHPEYAANASEWAFLRQAIEGGPGYVNGNLFKHPKEDPQVYDERKKRAADHHLNLTAQVVQTYLGYLFQTRPTPAEGLPEWLERFIASGDQEGRSLVELAKDVATWNMGYGIIWVGVDKPPAPKGPDGEPVDLSEAQEIELRLEPYAYLVHPTHVLDGRIERGVVKWLLVQEDKRDDADPINSSGQIITKLRLWTEAEWVLLSQVERNGGKEWEVEAKGTNPIKRVPFVPFRFGSGSGFACPGLVADIAHIDRAIFNKTSLLDEIHYAQTFGQLAIPYKGDLYEEDGTGGFKLTSEGQGILTMGLHTVLPYAAEAGAPGYVAPPNGPAEVLSKSIADMARMLLGLALLDGEVATEEGGAAPVSGVNKAYTFAKLNRRLAAIADRIEAGFAQVFDLAARWLLKDPEEIPWNAWDFPDNFDVRSLAQDIEEFSVLMAGNPPSHTAIALLWKAILRKALSKVDPEVWKEIEAEVDAMAERFQMGSMGPALGAGEPEEGDEEE